MYPPLGKKREREQRYGQGAHETLKRPAYSHPRSRKKYVQHQQTARKLQLHKLVHRFASLLARCTAIEPQSPTTMQSRPSFGEYVLTFACRDFWSACEPRCTSHQLKRNDASGRYVNPFILRYVPLVTSETRYTIDIKHSTKHRSRFCAIK